MIITKRDLMRIIKEEVERAKRLEKFKERKAALAEARARKTRRLREGGAGSGRLPGGIEWEDVDTPGPRGRPSSATLAAREGSEEIAAEFWYMLLSDLEDGVEPPDSIFDRAMEKLSGKGRPSDDDVAGASMLAQDLAAAGAPRKAEQLLAMIEPVPGTASRRGRPRTYRGGL